MGLRKHEPHFLCKAGNINVYSPRLSAQKAQSFREMGEVQEALGIDARGDKKKELMLWISDQQERTLDDTYFNTEKEGSKMYVLQKRAYT